MKRAISIGLLTPILALVLIACGGEQTALIDPVSIEQPPTGEVTEPPAGQGTLSLDQANSEFANRIIELANAERAQHGCPALTRNDQLTLVAYGHSQDMAQRDYLAHTTPEGVAFWQRMQSAGYQFSAAAENLAAVASTPESAMQSWLNSSGHQGNILDCGFTETGVGYFYLENDTGNVNHRHYWTQLFATP